MSQAILIAHGHERGISANATHRLSNPGTGIVSRHKQSTGSPQSRTVRVSELARDRDSERTATGKKMSTPAHSGIHAVADTFSNSYPNYCALGPQLIWR